MLKFVGLLLLIISFQVSADVLECRYHDGLDQGSLKNFDSVRTILDRVENRNFDPCLEKITPPTSQKELCQMSDRNFQSLLCKNTNRLGFDNTGGLFGLPTGLCWWISQFHRQATYQAYYCKECERPDFTSKKGKKELKKIFNSLIHQKGPTKIPGYANLNEFTSDPIVKKALIKRLQGRMASDSFLRMKWVNSLQGNAGKVNFGENMVLDLETLKSKKLAPPKRKNWDKVRESQNEEIEKVFKNVNEKNKISYIMLQMTFANAHSAIVFDAKKIKDDFGDDIYILKVQDSAAQNEASFAQEKYNKQENNYSTYLYKNGSWYQSSHYDASQDPERQLFFSEDFNIYLQNDKQREKLEKKMQARCQNIE